MNDKNVKKFNETEEKNCMPTSNRKQTHPIKNTKEEKQKGKEILLTL